MNITIYFFNLCFQALLVSCKIQRARLSESGMMNNHPYQIFQRHIQVDKDRMSNGQKKIYISVVVKTSSSRTWVFQTKILVGIY